MGLTSKAAALIAVSVIFPLLATAAVVLRLQARRTRSLALKGDDYWIVVALVITAAGSIPYIIGSSIGGVGAHVQDVLRDTDILLAKILFATQFFYIFSIAPVKISVLLFYKRIFVTRGFRMAANSVLTFVISWSIAFFFVNATLFQAWPISYNWTSVGTPTQYDIMYDACAATDILSDLLTLCLPMPMIKSLHLNARRKWILSSIFGLGGFCVVSSAVRLYYLSVINNPAEFTDPTYQTADILIWSSIEPCTSIICACLPTLGPLFRGGHTPESLVNSVRSYLSNRSRSTIDRRKERKSSGDTDFLSKKDLTAEEKAWTSKDSSVNSTVSAGAGTDLEAGGGMPPLPQGISVKTNTSIVRE